MAYDVEMWAKKNEIDVNLISIRRASGGIVRPTVCIQDGKLLNTNWGYHVVVEVDGIAHDAWFPELLPTKKYIRKNFGHYKDLVLNEDWGAPPFAA